MTKPVVTVCDGILVVRDDLFPGGTKARFLPHLMNGVQEYVYATPAEGGAQTAIAHVARHMGKRCTLFVAGRREPHPRSSMAAKMGAKIVEVKPGYLSCVQARAKSYCAVSGATILPFGLNVPVAKTVISSSARECGIDPDEVWCAAGSGVLARALRNAWPSAKMNVVQVGRKLTAADVLGAYIYVHQRAYGQLSCTKPPFPSDPHYDAKAWEMCVKHRGGGTVLFWNVTGPAVV